MLWLTLGLTILAYLVGSISSAILVCKLLSLPDPRTQGSNNPGATNVYRIGGKAAAISVLVFDILKGAVPVWGAYFLKVDPISLGIIALASCLGHMFPVFFQFKGGKAVATAFGVLLPIGLDLGGLLVLTWYSVAKITHYSSLAAIVSVSLAPFYIWLLKPLYTYPAMMLSILILLRHKANIVRLIKGTEPKITSKKLNS
ncbi:glycerol-3-phosphate acyltransferase [Thalassotalea insulae]|uniref:Glycerol-3-phosphate acyltransferase n=1 Tax=Thalassotalea insulae TaxID=2056778 RepID=A0ABQ6GSP3_9GAMM|nr:glycerol-3-phosphate 1-O-acyltransferase PlsY [Thalassotalea insulae]GLX77701.1 glycerol-3-phosphate acyltransferase [Thalassotalea insulae]